MNVSFAHLCDYATISKEGKISIMGIFQNINAHQLPAAHPSCYLAFELEAVAAETGRQFDLKIECVDSDGDAVFGIGGKIGLPVQKATPGGKLLIGQVMAIHGMQVKRFGVYNLNIFINAELKKTIEFEVTKPPASPGPTGPHGGRAL